ncbi:MAG: PstS family phosphate ABC transporter substrate-binding protein [Phycisphaerales bacterium]
MMNRLLRVGVGAACLLVGGGVVAQSSAGDSLLDPNLPEYTPAEGVTGSIKSVGSDTMNNLMTFWAESFMRFYPGVTVEVTGKGSSTAPPALTEGQSQFGPMSRQMKPSEEDAFEARFGYKPTLLRTGIDCLAVFVHKDCPIDELTLEQVRLIFSTAGPEMTWGDLGVEDPRFKFRQITLYGRNSASGTYGYFKKLALDGNDYKPGVKEQPGSSSVVQAVGSDPYAMGYSGLGFQTQDVKALAIASEGEQAVAPSGDSAYDGSYPLARFLYVYINKDPSRALEPLREEFIRLIFSREGQEAVLKDGYFPISADLATKQLTQLGLDPAS